MREFEPLRVEDPRFLTGRGRFVANLRGDEPLAAVFVRSPLPHAALRGVDADGARRLPGVLGVFTADDLGRRELPAARIFPPGLVARPLLACDVVRFAGEPVAVALAEGVAQAVEAAERVRVNYEPLAPLADPEAALEPDAPLLHPELGTNLVADEPFSSDGDVLAGADLVIRRRFVNQRLAPVPLECNGALAVPEPDGRLTVWTPTQVPYEVRNAVAESLGLDPGRIRVRTADSGGSFGGKGYTYPEQAVVAWLALTTGRPVRWLETRSENLVAMTHGRGQIQDVEIGARSDGTLVGLRVNMLSDGGAYPTKAALGLMTKQMAAGAYGIPRIEFNARCVATNTTPMGMYRGAGRPEAATLVERAVDLVARRLGLDPVELRRRNLLGRDRFPFSSGAGAVYDSGDFEPALDRALDLVGYDDLRREQAALRREGGVSQLGIGVSTYVESTGGNPPREIASLTLRPDGTFVLAVGTTSQGHGHETTYADLAAGVLGVHPRTISVVEGDTDALESGAGTYASRSVQLGGNAVVRAAEELLARAGTQAGTPVAWSELASASPEPLRVQAEFEQAGRTASFGTHVAVVSVDTETGRVDLLRFVAVDDCGTVSSPLLARGQVHGGIAQGVGQALMEGVTFDDEARPRKPTLGPYRVPRALDLPAFATDTTTTPSPLNPSGAKGIGEAGAVGSTVAVQNAVVDALSHLGVEHVDLPLTPERVWSAVEAASRTPAAEAESRDALPVASR